MFQLDTMFRFLQPFPDNYQNYKLRDYHNNESFCTKWHSENKIGCYACYGVNGRYEFHVRDDNIIDTITYYSDITGKIEIDSFGKKSVPYEHE